jgi:hypothetical protein
MSKKEIYLVAPVTKSIESILEDPSTSHWLKAALSTSVRRDHVDVLNDIDILLGLYINMDNAKRDQKKFIDSRLEVVGVGTEEGFEEKFRQKILNSL